MRPIGSHPRLHSVSSANDAEIPAYESDDDEWAAQGGVFLRRPTRLHDESHDPAELLPLTSAGEGPVAPGLGSRLSDAARAACRTAGRAASGAVGAMARSVRSCLTRLRFRFTGDPRPGGAVFPKAPGAGQDVVVSLAKYLSVSELADFEAASHAARAALQHDPLLRETLGKWHRLRQLGRTHYRNFARHLQEVQSLRDARDVEGVDREVAAMEDAQGKLTETCAQLERVAGAKM
jgi:hypothetical protein